MTIHVNTGIEVSSGRYVARVKAAPARVAAIAKAAADGFVRLGHGEILHVHAEGSPESGLFVIDQSFAVPGTSGIVSWGGRWGCLDLTLAEPSLASDFGEMLQESLGGDAVGFAHCATEAVLSVRVGGVTVTFGAIAEDIA